MTHSNEVTFIMMLLLEARLPMRNGAAPSKSEHDAGCCFQGVQFNSVPT
jgi:hypothetical protein